MQWFGGDTRKPMALFSNAPWISDLELYKPKEHKPPQKRLYVLIESKTGEFRPAGNSDLKSSQHYTPEFGQAMAEIFTKHRKSWRRTRSSSGKKCECSAGCPSMEALLTRGDLDNNAWDDAQLHGVFARLQADALKANKDTLVEVV
jgi:hypothetical protein